MLASSWLSVQLLRSSRIGYSVLTDVQIRPTPSCAVSVWRYKPPPSSFMISADRWVNVPPPKQSNVVTSKSVRIIQCQGGGGPLSPQCARASTLWRFKVHLRTLFTPRLSAVVTVTTWCQHHTIQSHHFRLFWTSYWISRYFIYNINIPQSIHALRM